jgi:hypothetical protein
VKKAILKKVESMIEDRMTNTSAEMDLDFKNTVRD